MLELEAGNIKKAYRLLNSRHREAGGTTTKPCYASMEAQTKEREDLYNFKALPDEHILPNPILLPNVAPPLQNRISGQQSNGTGRQAAAP